MTRLLSSRYIFKDLGASTRSDVFLTHHQKLKTPWIGWRQQSNISVTSHLVGRKRRWSRGSFLTRNLARNEANRFNRNMEDLARGLWICWDQVPRETSSYEAMRLISNKTFCLFQNFNCTSSSNMKFIYRILIFLALHEAATTNKTVFQLCGGRHSQREEEDIWIKF